MTTGLFTCVRSMHNVKRFFLKYHTRMSVNSSFSLLAMTLMGLKIDPASLALFLFFLSPLSTLSTLSHFFLSSLSSLSLTFPLQNVHFSHFFILTASPQRGSLPPILSGAFSVLPLPGSLPLTTELTISLHFIVCGFWPPLLPSLLLCPLGFWPPPIPSTQPPISALAWHTQHTPP